MAKTNQKNQQDQKELLVGFVRELHQLNKINNDLIQAPIEDVIDNPEKYATDYMEIMFSRHINRFILAYKLGKEFALSNKGVIIKNNKRYYLNNKPIDKKLPENYSFGNTLDKPNEHCHNCKFYVESKTGDYCAQWDALVRDEYWCKKWQKISK